MEIFMQSEWLDVVQSVRLDGDKVEAKTCFLPLFLLFGLGASNRAQGAVRPGMTARPPALYGSPAGTGMFPGNRPVLGYRPMQGSVSPRAPIVPPPIARPGLKPGGCG